MMQVMSRLEFFLCMIFECVFLNGLFPIQDYIRTSTYQRAILANAGIDFAGKVVLDVGAGSGILSFFAVQSGAKRVYAVEASNMAVHCQNLVKANKLAGRIVVIR